MLEDDYFQRHKDLMKKWSEKELHKDKHFIEDGIIDIKHWPTAKRKILLLLKEAYGDYADLCSLIRDEWKGPKWKLWLTASRWLYALQKISTNYIPLFPQEKKQYDECVEYLLSSAVVNIKKSDGKKSSNHEDISKYVKEDGELLREQISLIAPDVILCGGTFEYFKKFWTDKTEPVGETGYVFKKGDCIVIDYWHPANRYPNKLCFYALCAILQDSRIL